MLMPNGNIADTVGFDVVVNTSVALTMALNV